jgi:hypothetical protein
MTDGPVVFDPSDFGAIPTSRSLRQWMRTTRRRHADRSFWQIFEDVYLVLFTLAMFGATAGNVVRHLNSNAARCTSYTCGRLSEWMPWIMVPLLLAITVRMLLAVGPVSASRASGFWLLATPVNRAALLRPAYRLVTATVAVAGLVAAAIIWALIGSSFGVVLEAAVLISALLVCAAIATVWAQQSTRRSRWTLRVADLLLIAALVPAAILAFQHEPTRNVQTANVVLTFAEMEQVSAFDPGGPRRLVIAGALLVVPYAVAGAGFDVLVPIAAAFAGFIAVRPMLDGLRTVCRSTGLVRAMGMDLRELRVVMAVVPGLFTVLWAGLAFPAIGSLSATFAVAGGVISGAVRQASARPPTYSGPLVASPMGAIPPGLFSQPARGFDLLLLCLAPVLLNLTPLWVVAIPAFVLTVMFSVRPKTD